MTLSKSISRSIWASERFPGGSGLWRGGLWASQRAAVISATAQIRNLLFSEGQQGILYHPKPVVDEEQVLWQQSNGTIVVDTQDDPVGRMDDLSTNGNNATQGTSSNKPLYKTDGTLHWLNLDRVNDHLVLPSGLASAPEVFFCGYAEPVDFVSQQDYFEFSSNNGITGVRALIASGQWFFQAGDGSARYTIQSGSSAPNPILTLYITGDTLFARINGTQVGSIGVPAYSPNAGASYLGAAFESGVRNFASGKIGVTVQTNYAPSLEDIQEVESFVAEQSGVSI